MYFFKLRYVKNQFDLPKNDFLIKNTKSLVQCSSAICFETLNFQKICPIYIGSSSSEFKS